ncbi:unnamed protein product [Bursaphelenchus xylophilus]|uniref:(pine wood nematode) hypothetical protein n=1 Tax=Bursaphelenchus xylophilus TaxID=6326 RepID=A0A1I7SL98_BURXY|nr:unnamed protein product [Bursaphelenchus xylophilus]CAG9129435.1 unnamed protein product [Bursaphelenchus xylophilus]
MSLRETYRILPAPTEYLESFSVPKPLAARINKTSFRVTYVETNSPLLNRAFVGDQLVAIDGQPIKTADFLSKKLAEKKKTVIVQFKHAFFSYCTFLGASVERLQLDKEVFKTTGRAVNLFTIHFFIPNIPKDSDDDRKSEILKFAVRYDARERVQVAHCDPSGIGAVHLRAGDIIKDVNEHPISSKAMLKFWINDAVTKGESVQLNIERLVSGDDAIRDLVDTSQDVMDIAQKQINAIKNKTVKAAPKVLSKRGAPRKNSTLTLAEQHTEYDIHADHDPTKLKPCKGAKQ